MAINPFTKRPKERPVFTRTFEDDGATFTLTFRKPGQIENSAAYDLGEELVERYLGTDTKPGPGFPPIGGIAVHVTETALKTGALYAVMQPADAVERYSAEEFVAFQATLSDECWQAVASFSQEVRDGTASVPPTCEADTASSSASASPSAEATPK